MSVSSPAASAISGRKCGIKQVYICPDLNYGAAVHADKWIPILPNTDAALQLAIIYTWIKEGTYDKEYVKTHTVGFDKIEDYVLGKEDGIPKTPEWASEKCGVPEWTIKALARDWAKKTVSIAHYFGGSYVRGPYSHEPARLECILLGMQGLGGPGVHQVQIYLRRHAAGRKADRSTRFFNPAARRAPDHARLRPPSGPGANSLFPRPWSIRPSSIRRWTFWGSGGIEEPVEDQFMKYNYPIAKEKGGTEIHMIWSDTPCRTTCWNGGNETIEADAESQDRIHRRPAPLAGE